MISSSGRKRKIKPETFSRNLTKAARLGNGMVREKLSVLRVRTLITTTKFVRHMSAEEINVKKINQELYYLS